MDRPGGQRCVGPRPNPYRQLAGLIEVAMKDHFADKTQWRAMLTAGNPDQATTEG